MPLTKIYFPPLKLIHFGLRFCVLCLRVVVYRFKGGRGFRRRERGLPGLRGRRARAAADDERRRGRAFRARGGVLGLVCASRAAANAVLATPAAASPRRRSNTLTLEHGLVREHPALDALQRLGPSIFLKHPEDVRAVEAERRVTPPARVDGGSDRLQR